MRPGESKDVLRWLAQEHTPDYGEMQAMLKVD
jgi:hypothetical protein